MKIRLNKDAISDKYFFDNHAIMSYEREYEVISIIYQFLRDLDTHKVYKISYVLLSDDLHLITTSSEKCIIVDNSLDSDMIYEYSKYIDAYILHPMSLSVTFFMDRFAHNDLLEYTEAFCKRFKHLLSEYKYAECFKEQYQDPSRKIIAEPIGENWVLCPECNEAFEVNDNQGVITCPNTVCKMQMNNPYAKKFPVIFVGTRID